MVKRVEGALILAAGIAFGACLRLAYESFMYERPGGGHDRYKALRRRIRFDDGRVTVPYR